VDAVGKGWFQVSGLHRHESGVPTLQPYDSHQFPVSPKDGTYTARYHAPYYLPEPWPPSEPAAFQPFQVTAAGNPVRLEARMIPEGRMTGRVIDGRDEPVPNARLYLTSSTVVLVMSTDARGNFDQHLLPGAYTLSAAPWPDRKPPDPERGSDGVLSWARTYYPGTAVPEGATKIVLRPGAEVAGIDQTAGGPRASRSRSPSRPVWQAGAQGSDCPGR
jgi:hypothetical protein